MPPALFRVEEASQFLQEAVQLLTQDPTSQLGRKRLIEGSRGLPAAHEAQMNRDYFLRQMSDEIQEIIRGLQLTSADDIDWQCGEHAGLRSAKNLIGRLAKYGNAWLTDPMTLNASSGEKAIRQILDAAHRFETLCLSDAERNGLTGLIRALHTEVDDLVAAHQRGDMLAAQNIGATGQQNFAKLLDLCDALCERTEHHNAIYRLARTLEGKVTQVQRWLAAPRGSQRQVGYEACRALISEAGLLIKLETTSDGGSRVSAEGQDSVEAFQECCDNLQRSADCLYAQVEKPFSPEQEKIENKMSQEISRNLAYLWHCLQFGLVRQVADFFTDLMGPIKRLQEVACPPHGEPVNEEAYRIASDTFLVGSFPLLELFFLIAYSDPKFRLRISHRNVI
ncbi:unnamed protein product [Schistocephalus solidus]|uniref:Vinculin n=1 Tax=Schistocephalus solidus TaxID=70667 RepID=A0A183TLD8_SCHSO|nr:unnamed protein product [Schistocephalus solidus]